MRLLIDNALGVSVAEGLRQAGHDAIHVRDLGMARASDDEILRLASEERRTIVSADTDFGLLLATSGRSQPSFLLLRCADRRPAAVLKMLLANLDRLSEDIEAGCVAVFEDQRIRVRRLPL
jgi:predicted nuclease of predicted toxin-antitoxin system